MSKKNSHYTAEEIEYLETHYANTPNKKLAEKLGRKPESIRDKANNLGLTKGIEIERLDINCSYCGKKIDYLNLPNRWSRKKYWEQTGKMYCSPECAKEKWAEDCAEKVKVGKLVPY